MSNLLVSFRRFLFLVEQKCRRIIHAYSLYKSYNLPKTLPQKKKLLTKSTATLNKHEDIKRESIKKSLLYPCYDILSFINYRLSFPLHIYKRIPAQLIATFIVMLLILLNG